MRDESSATAPQSNGEGILGIECTEDTRDNEVSSRTQSTEPIERYQSTEREDEPSRVELGDESTEASTNIPPKQSPWSRLVKRLGKAGAVALCVCVPLVIVVVVVVAVCCALPKETLDPPTVTASVEMNGESREVSNDDIVNKAPAFTLQYPDMPKEGCKTKTRYTVKGQKTGKWGMDLPAPGSTLDGTYQFEFMYTCRRVKSRIAHLNLIIDKALPDILVKEEKPTAGRWIGLSFNAPDKSDTSNIEWTVEQKVSELTGRTAGESESALIETDEEGQRFAVGEAGTLL